MGDCLTEKRFLSFLVEQHLSGPAAFGRGALDETAFHTIGKILVVKSAAILSKDLGPLGVHSRFGANLPPDGTGQRLVDSIVSWMSEVGRKADSVLGLLSHQATEKHRRGAAMRYSPPSGTMVSLR